MELEDHNPPEGRAPKRSTRSLPAIEIVREPSTPSQKWSRRQKASDETTATLSDWSEVNANADGPTRPSSSLAVSPGATTSSYSFFESRCKNRVSPSPSCNGAFAPSSPQPTTGTKDDHLISRLVGPPTALYSASFTACTCTVWLKILALLDV